MAGIAVHVGHVLRADDIALRPRIVPLAGVGNGIATGIQDAVSPVGAPAQAAPDDAAVDGALRLAGLDGRKDLEVRIVEQVGALLEQRDLALRLHPAHLVHHRRAVHHGQLRQLALDFLPVRRAHVVLLEADALAAEPEALQHLRQPPVRRLGVRFV